MVQSYIKIMNKRLILHVFIQNQTFSRLLINCLIMNGKAINYNNLKVISYGYSITTKASSSMTLWPTLTQMAVTLPLFSASILLAIFIASKTTTVSPA